MRKAELATDKDVMQAANCRATETTLGGGYIAPELEHFRGATRVDLRVEHEGDNLRSRPVDEVSPGKVERNHILPVRPHALPHTARGMKHVTFLDVRDQSFNSFLAAVFISWIGDVGP